LWATATFCHDRDGTLWTYEVCDNNLHAPVIAQNKIEIVPRLVAWLRT
jgi:hypothetical protein